MTLPIRPEYQMHHVFNGLRAGLFSALVLTLWSFVSLLGPMNEAATSTGFLYVLTAFGLTGLPQVLYGLGLGAIVALWARLVIGSRTAPGLLGSLESPATDRRAASLLLLAPLMTGAMAVAVSGVHLAVTSKFVRASFQAIGIGAASAALLAGMLVVAPLLLAGLERLIARLPRKDDDTRPVLTRGVLALYGLGALGAVLAGYGYASSLHVWAPELLRMGVAAVLLTPVFFAVMSRLKLERVVWRYGLPLAGTLAVVVCFFGAREWATSSQEMRQATLRDGHLVTMIARRVVPTGAAGDAATFAFDDCDDETGECEGAPAEAIPLDSLDHPARRTMRLAVETGEQAAVRKFEQIPPPPPNFVFVLIDTLRPDHLGYAGYERNTSPNIDQIASESVVFMDAYATSPHTPRSIPPLFFSQYASRMKWYGAQYNYPRVRPENLGLFEVLEERGYRNIGMTSHFYFEERRGLYQGFERWDNEGAGTIAESNDDIAAPRIWAKTEPMIEELGRERREKGDDARPFSLFVHLFEPHARWIGHSEFDFGRGETPRERHINNYDSEIAFTDSYIGKLVDKLKAEGLYDQSILVITSDHGEAFNEHGVFFHGSNLYNEVVRVPLIVRVPGWYSRKVEGPVSIIDVAPTVLDLFQITIPQEFAGVSLVDTMLGRSQPPRRPIFVELLPYTHFKEHHRAVIFGQEKFIQNFTLGIEEFFDLAEDPGEQNNLRSREPERAERLKKMLEEFMGQ